MRTIEKFIQELPVTRKDIIEILQRYKSAWCKIFRKNVHLDFKEGEIQVYAEPAGTRYDKNIVLKQVNFRALGLEELLSELYIVKLVEEWMEQLTPREREALFWRYIQHDFEPAPVEQEINWGLRYKTLPERVIAQKMSISRSSLRDYLNSGLQKILRHVST